jgi:anti-sigma factor RsiW
MSPIDPAELSALIDGELPPERAGEVRRALAADPELRAVYDRLVHLDGSWKAAAAGAAFPPRVALGTRPGISLAGIALVAVGLLALRLVLKLLPPFSAPVLILEVLGLILVAGWGLRQLVRVSERDRPVADGLA